MGATSSLQFPSAPKLAFYLKICHPVKGNPKALLELRAWGLTRSFASFWESECNVMKMQLVDRFQECSFVAECPGSYCGCWRYRCWWFTLFCCFIVRSWSESIASGTHRIRVPVGQRLKPTFECHWVLCLWLSNLVSSSLIHISVLDRAAPSSPEKSSKSMFLWPNWGDLDHVARCQQSFTTWQLSGTTDRKPHHQLPHASVVGMWCVPRLGISVQGASSLLTHVVLFCFPLLHCVSVYFGEHMCCLCASN